MHHPSLRGFAGFVLDMRVLLLNQAFYPDLVSTGLHLSELAMELKASGHAVTVVTSSRAYDNPALRFARKEMWNGITIHRVGGSAFGKGAIWRRAVDFATNLAATALRLICVGHPDVVIALTSPPMISVLGAMFSQFYGARFFYWVMDFNPDEAIAAGALRSGSLSARMLETLSRYSLSQAEKVVALDRFMLDRIMAKGIEREKIVVLAPWSLDKIGFDARGRAMFRDRHRIGAKFVVMYSGNHSPCHPLDTLLGAARCLREDREILFMFVGGGSEFKRIKQIAEAEHLKNVLCLPYQPLEELAGSLSAADLHCVVMGDPFVGLVHPCKLYNIIRVGAPVLYVGPAGSHIPEIFEKLDGAWSWASRRHGDVQGTVEAIQAARRQRFRASPEVAMKAVRPYSGETIIPKLIKIVQPTG